MEPNALDLTKTLTRHPDGFFVARVVVGYLKKGSVEETMILIDPCLAASDDKESVFHFAISENRMEYREDGEFKKIARARPAETTGCAHLVQVAVGTWEQRASVGAACLCSCHPLFYDDSAAHDQVQHCELRYLAAHIAVQLRTNADLRELTLPARPMLNLEFHVHPFARNAAINNKDPKKLCGEFLNRMIETRLVDTKNILRVHLQSDMDYEDSTAFQSLKNYQRSVIPSDFTRSLALEKTGKGRVLTNKGDKIELDEKPVSHSFACLHTAADGFTELLVRKDRPRRIYTISLDSCDKAINYDSVDAQLLKCYTVSYEIVNNIVRITKFGICSYDSSMTRILKTVARDNGANTVYWPIKVPKTVLDLVKNDRRAYCEDLTKLINRLNIKSCYEIRSTIHILPSENDFDGFINSCEEGTYEGKVRIIVKHNGQMHRISKSGTWKPVLTDERNVCVASFVVRKMPYLYDIYDIDARRVFDVSLGFFDLEYEQPEWSTIGYHQHFDQGEHISDEQIANVSSDDSFDATPVKSIVMNETARVGSFEFSEQKEIDNVNSNDKLLQKEAITHFESQSPFSFDVVESQGVLRSTRNDEQSDKLQDISADNDAHSFDSFDQIGPEHNEQVAEPAIQQEIIGVDAIISSNHYTEGELLNTNSSSLVLMALNASAMVKTQGELRLASTDEQKVDNDAASFDSFSQIETQHNEQSAEKVVMRVDADVAEYNKQKEIEIIQVVTATSRQSDSTGNDVEVIEKNSEKDAQKLTKEGATEKTKSVKRVLKESEEGVVEKKSKSADQQCEIEDDIEIFVERRHECETIALSIRQLLFNTRTRGRLIRVLDAQKLARMAKMSPFELFETRSTSAPVVFIFDTLDLSRIIFAEGNHRLYALAGRELSEAELDFEVHMQAVKLGIEFDALWNVAITMEYGKASINACAKLEELPASLSQEVLRVAADALKISLAEYSEFSKLMFYCTTFKSLCNEAQYARMQNDVGLRNRWLDKLVKAGFYPPLTGKAKEFQAPSVFLMKPRTRLNYLGLLSHGIEIGTNHCFETIQKASVVDDALTANVLVQCKNAKRGKEGLSRKSFHHQFDAIAKGKGDAEKIRRGEAITEVLIVDSIDDVGFGETVVFGRKVPDEVNALLANNCVVFVVCPHSSVIRRQYRADVKIRSGTMAGSCFGLGGTLEYICLGVNIVEDNDDDVSVKTSTRIVKAWFSAHNINKKKNETFVAKCIKGYEVKTTSK